MDCGWKWLSDTTLMYIFTDCGSSANTTTETDLVMLVSLISLENHLWSEHKCKTLFSVIFGLRGRWNGKDVRSRRPGQKWFLPVSDINLRSPFITLNREGRQESSWPFVVVSYNLNIVGARWSGAILGGWGCDVLSHTGQFTTLCIYQQTQNDTGLFRCREEPRWQSIANTTTNEIGHLCTTSPPLEQRTLRHKREVPTFLLGTLKHTENPLLNSMDPEN